jgi:large subunit ribosomal protein L29
MKASEIRSKNLEELAQMLIEALQEQFNLRMQKVPGQAVKSHLVKEVRQRIARIKTIMTEKSR